MRPIVDIGGYVGEEYLRDSYGDYLASLASVEGRLRCVRQAQCQIAALVQPCCFAGAGYTEPSTWDELLTLSDQMVRDGHTPWCLGLGSGEATGWPATDWLGTVVLRSEGPEFYDRWAAQEIPFDHPAVVNALEKLGVLAHIPGYVSPDPAYIRDRPWEESVFLASQEDPQCWMLPAAEFVANYFGDAPMAVIPFPTIDPAFASAVEGGGDLADRRVRQTRGPSGD